MKRLFLFTLFISAMFVSCNNAENTGQTTASQQDKEAISRTLEFYMEGSRQGNSKITAKAFAEGATLSGIYQGKFMVAPIQVLYDLVDQQGPKESDYTITTCSVEGEIAIVRIEANFGKKRYTDMFTMVKDGNDWKIVSKVYHLHYVLS